MAGRLLPSVLEEPGTLLEVPPSTPGLGGRFGLLLLQIIQIRLAARTCDRLKVKVDVTVQVGV
jgi:hypothetical protein